MAKLKFKDENGDFVPVVQDVTVNGDSVFDGVEATVQLKTINSESIVGTGNISISGGSATDVQVNGTSIVSSGVANLVTNTAYNASSNKLATMSDIPSADVTGPSSSTNGHVAVFDGTTGKVIKDGAYTIAASVPSGAVFTDTMPTITTVGNGNVVTDVSISGTTITQTRDVLVQMVQWDITFTDNTTMQLPVCYATAAL